MSRRSGSTPECGAAEPALPLEPSGPESAPFCSPGHRTDAGRQGRPPAEAAEGNLRRCGTPGCTSRQVRPAADWAFRALQAWTLQQVRPFGLRHRERAAAATQREISSPWMHRSRDQVWRSPSPALVPWAAVAPLPQPLLVSSSPDLEYAPRAWPSLLAQAAAASLPLVVL